MFSIMSIFMVDGGYCYSQAVTSIIIIVITNFMVDILMNSIRMVHIGLYLHYFYFHGSFSVTSIIIIVVTIMLERAEPPGAVGRLLLQLILLLLLLLLSLLLLL